MYLTYLETKEIIGIYSSCWCEYDECSTQVTDDTFYCRLLSPGFILPPQSSSDRGLTRRVGYLADCKTCKNGDYDISRNCYALGA
jgi:hypothetical protein